jgi:drug/metabolite transporter (DMT)-like permease
MKTIAAALAVLLPAAASAHEVGVVHFHPHPDPALLVGGVAIVGVVALVALIRDDRK